ncbi:MAG: DUF1499 domain-containing protein [Alphaproteobacteria bacterium]|nr:DUF1499 domain-containing protein [Alphaproteobacteria bacterium]
MPFARSTLTVLVFLVAGCEQTAGAGGQADNGQVPLSLENLQRREAPNDYLVCPPGHCLNSKPDRPSPIFDVSAAELRRRLDALVSSRPRSSIVFADEMHMVVEERSAFFGFPDLIDVETIETGEAKSTLAIYSRSKYGYYDFGVNKRRVETWLRELAASPK